MEVELNKRNEVVLASGEKIVLPLPVPQAIEVAYLVMSGEILDVADIAKYCKITLGAAMKVITNNTFLEMVHKLTLANARIGFDAVAFKKLMHIAQHSEAERLQIQAIKTLADIMGLNESKKSSSPTVNINIDQIVRSNNKSPFPGL